MIVSRAVVNDSGIALIAAQSELTEPLIDKIRQMNIGSVFIVGPGKPASEKEKKLQELDEMFAPYEEDTYMLTIKRALIHYLEGQYR